MRVLFILLLQNALVHSGLVQFDAERMRDSFRLQETEVYAGQYPCLPADCNGTRNLVTFAIVLQNTGTEAARVGPLKVVWSLENVTTGEFALSCVRDTECDKGNKPRFYVCRFGGLSPECRTHLNARTRCQWVDFTGLDPWARYRLSLALDGPGPIDTGSSVFEFVPAQLVQAHLASTSQSLWAMAVLLVPNIIYFIILIVATARQNHGVTHVVTYRQKQD